MVVRKKLITVAAILLAVGVAVYYSLQKTFSMKGQSPAQIVKDTLTAAKVRADLIPLVIAQGMHESANFSSNVYRTLNNVFGWKYVGTVNQQKPGTMSPEGNVYGAYKSIVDSAKDQAAYFNRRKPPLNMTPTQFAQYLFNQKYYTQNAKGNAVNIYSAAVAKWLVVAQKII